MNIYAGLPAFHPRYIQGDVFTRYDRLRGDPSPIQGPSPGNVYDPMRGINYPIPGQVTNPGSGYLQTLNDRAMRVLGLTPPQSPGMGQGFGFGGQPGDLVKRLLQARFGGL